MDKKSINRCNEGRLRRFIRLSPGYCIRGLIAGIALLFVFGIYVLVSPLALYDMLARRRKPQTGNSHAAF